MPSDVKLMGSESDSLFNVDSANKIQPEMTVQDVCSWANMVLSKWGSSGKVIRQATDSVSARNIDGKTLLSLVAEGAEKVCMHLSLPARPNVVADTSAIHDMTAYSQILVDGLSAKVLINAAINGLRTNRHLLAVQEIVSWMKQSLGENAAKAGTSEHAICLSLESMQMDSDRLGMLLPEDAEDLIPFHMRPHASLATRAALSQAWAHVYRMVLSKDSDEGNDVIAQVFIHQCT
jgi:hypothetical protein